MGNGDAATGHETGHGQRGQGARLIWVRRGSSWGRLHAGGISPIQPAVSKISKFTGLADVGISRAEAWIGRVGKAPLAA
jgi:hypothetical protein